jgi:type III secretory pathway lipoprotein EscJ
MSYGVNFSYWGDKAVNFYFNVNANDNRTVSSIRPGSATNYWTYQINGNTQIKLKKIKTFIDFNIEGNIYQKSKIFPDQRDVIIVSPSIRKVLGKTDSWEVKMYVFDMLNQNTNIQRNITSNFISESSNNGIRRYTMFSLIYNFSKNGKPSNMGF